MTIIRANTKNELYYILSLVVIIGCSAVFTGKPATAFFICGPFILLVLAFNLFDSKLNEIQIDKMKSKLTLVYRNYFKVTKELVFEIANIEFAYKRIDTIKYKDERLCILYSAGKEIAKMHSVKDNFPGDQLFDLIHELKQLGVKRKFTGYMMKDAEV